MAWTRPDFDLDDATPARIGRLLERDRPEVVVHAAAWTDVDACARAPDLAERRNGVATGALAEALAQRGLDLIAISTNEVFDGRRTHGCGYAPTDETGPLNAYGSSKLMGQQLARAAYAPAGRSRAEPDRPQDGVPDAPHSPVSVRDCRAVCCRARLPDEGLAGGCAARRCMPAAAQGEQRGLRGSPISDWLMPAEGQLPSGPARRLRWFTTPPQ